MTIHVNIGEAKTRLSELVAAAIRGEDVVVSKAGEPQVRLVPVSVQAALTEEARRARRQSAFGMYRHLVHGEPPVVRDLKPNDAQRTQLYEEKFGAAD